MPLSRQRVRATPVRGFAVVAEEVRSLAQRSASAARNTAELIEDSIQKVAHGEKKVELVAQAIHRITEDSTTIHALVADVSTGSEEQTRGVKLMATALLQMERVTQKTAASAQQSASSVDHLQIHADSLMLVVEQVTSLVGAARTKALNPYFLNRTILPVFARTMIRGTNGQSHQAGRYGCFR